MSNIKEHYNKKGLYSGYDKNHKERSAEDYYATPPAEVENILNVLKLPLNKQTILEPCCGGGHMVTGITNYIYNQNYDSKLWKIIATDIKDRKKLLREIDYKAGLQYDFISDNYPYTANIDYIIMNPPFSLIEPFVMKSLGIANKGVLMFGRLQFLEGEKRYTNILKECPPSDIYVYVDRINLHKNGDPSIKVGAVQAYAWYYWNLKQNKNNNTLVHWIRRIDKI